MMIPELDEEQPQPITSEHIVRIGAQSLLVLIVVAGLVVMCCGGCASPRPTPQEEELSAQLREVMEDLRRIRNERDEARLAIADAYFRGTTDALKPENVQ